MIAFTGTYNTPYAQTFNQQIIAKPLLRTPPALLIRPTAHPSAPIPPLDHDKFLQFAESNLADTEESAKAYYAAVDPSGQRTTIEAWRVLNGLDDSVLKDAEGHVLDDDALRNIGVEHALYRNATDLGFVRNIYMRNFNGKVVALLENYADFASGIAAFQQRDTSAMLAAVVMEYGAVKLNGPLFTQFYGYQNQDGKPTFTNGDLPRVEKLDLTGRGKQEAFPGLCATCHGGYPGGVDIAGVFKPHDPAYRGAGEGNFGGGFLPWDPDLYKFHDPNVAASDGAESSLGSGTFSRANQEDNFKELNRLMLLTDPTRAARELVEGWYGGSELPRDFNGAYVPDGWKTGDTNAEKATNKSFYKTVIAKYCRACHIQRAFPESDFTASFRNSDPIVGSYGTFPPESFDSQMDLDSTLDLHGLYKQTAKTVFEHTTMPMALVTYNKFWSDNAAVQSFVDYINQYDPFIQTAPDASGNPVAVRPGRPIAIPGAYSSQITGRPLQLDGSGSFSPSEVLASDFLWSLTPTSGASLSATSSATPTFTASRAGRYTVSLTVTGRRIQGGGLTSETSAVASTTITVVSDPFARVTYESSIRNSPTNARCMACHKLPDSAGYQPFDDPPEVLDMTLLKKYAIDENGNFVARLLSKPSGLLADYHNF